MADQLQVRVDTKSGRATLAAGRPFVGGVYDFAVTVDGQTDTTRLVRLYRLDPARRIKWVLAEAKGGQELALDSADFRKAFLTVAPSRALPCELFVYDGDAIVAQGNVVIEWSPTLTTVDGTPVDVQGPVGEKGDKGDKGDPGEDGKDGKSAYQGAVEQGYQGTEAQFYKELGGLTKAVEAANEAAKEAENAKSGAENAKGTADASATAAAGSASAASSSAQGAAQSASAAASAAQSASESVQAIQTTVQSVVGAVSTAQAAAKDAEAAKRGAQTAEQGATTAADNADASAKVAKEQASKAQECAQAAAKDAERVSGVIGGVKAQVDRLVQTAQEAKETIGDLANGAALSAEASASSAEAAAKYADEVVDAKLAAEQKAKEASESANAASRSATAAQTAKTQAETARDAANTAKQGAEAAKAGAESAKASAEASATKAATSATNAAQSATVAQEAAESVETNASRIGYGFVKPGSPLVIIGGDGMCFTLVALVDDMANTRASCHITRTVEGGYWFAMAVTKNAEKNAWHCYLLDDDLKPAWDFWLDHNETNGAIPHCVVSGGVAFVKTSRRLARVALNADGTGTVEKQVVTPKCFALARPQIALNPKSGHLYVVRPNGTKIAGWDVYDAELNATGASIEQGETSWFIYKGWLYGLDRVTLRRMLADDTVADVAPTDGSPLKWNTLASELGGTGNNRTWNAPIFAYRGKYELYDGLYKYAVTFGEEDEMILGSRSAFTTNMPIGFVGNFGFLPERSWTYIFGFVDNRAVAAMTPNLLNFSNSACFAFPGFAYANPYTWAPLAFFDANLRSFRVMMRGAVMVNLVPGMAG